MSNTYQITLELDNYLDENNHCDELEETNINQKVLDLWDTRFKSAITADIRSKFNDVEIEFISSKFELTSADNQGACLFFHKLTINDKINSELIKAYVKTLVNINKTTIYLDSSYESIEKYEGRSNQLKVVFDRINIADKNFGYFNPITLVNFIK